MQTETQTRTPNLLPQLAHARNPGMALDLDWVASVQANTSAIERRAATLGGRRSVKKEYQAAWLLKAISLIDLTTLSGDDTAGRVKRLCAKARQPVRVDMLDALGLPGLTVGAVCVYHDMVETAVKALEGSGIPVNTFLDAALNPSVMMLLGWGTLAVPTGIVTAEMTSHKLSHRSQTATRTCHQCLSEGHLVNAQYCFQCGAPLPDSLHEKQD